MTYDSARGMTVLFGGHDGSYRGDTWEWDGSTWTQRSTTGPSPRLSSAMAYDSGRGVTVLFGGYYYGGSAVYYGDTWEWDGTEWTQRSTAGPRPRRDHAMIYNDALDAVVLFGGRTGSYQYTNDAWRWDGQAWTPLALGAGPSSRGSHAMVYDAARGTTVLFGGESYVSGSLIKSGEIWEWHLGPDYVTPAHAAVTPLLMLCPSGPARR